MKTETFLAKSLKKLLLQHKIATMQELKTCMGSDVTMTVLRKLKELSYLTSYSHNGKYYTLAITPRFNSDGLWSYNEVCFSQHGTLINTINKFILSSPTGFSRKNLEEILHVDIKKQLHFLLKEEKIKKEKIGKKPIYFSSSINKYKQQRLTRQQQLENTTNLHGDENFILAHELRAAIILFFSILDERQRRLYAGLESLKLGRGGDKKISELLGIEVHTVAKGRKNLLEQDVEVERIRKKGGGRHSAEKKHLKSSKQ